MYYSGLWERGVFMLHQGSSPVYVLPVKTIYGFTLGLTLVCTLLILTVRLVGGILPGGERMPVAITHDQNPPDIAMLDPGRGLFYFLMRDRVWDNSPAVSPDGNQVVFTSYPDGTGGLWIIDLTTHQKRLLITGQVYYWLPAWSPDGTQIVFTASDTLITEIYLMTLADGSLRRMTDDTDIDMYATWSPDGRYLMYVGSDGFDPAGLYVMPVDCPQVDGVCGLVARQLTNQPGFDVSPAWSPDGARVAFASDRGGSWDIYVMDTDCVGVDVNLPCIPRVRQMTRQHYPNQIGPVSWSSDGQQVRFLVKSGVWNLVYGLDVGCEQTDAGCVLHRLAMVR